MKKLILFSLILIAFSCSEEPTVKHGLEVGKVYSKKELDAALSKDPIPPGYCIVFSGGGYIVVRC